MPIKNTDIEAAALFSVFMETTAEGFWLLDEIGRILGVNKAYGLMSGYQTGDLVGLLASDIDVADGAADVAARIARIHSDGSEVFESRHRRKDGSIFDVEISATILPNSGGKLICLCRDISLRKQTESVLKRNAEIQAELQQTLRANEAELRNLIRALPLPMAIINRAGEHTYINERFTQFFGYSLADIPTRDHWRQAAFPDENYLRWALQAWKEAVLRMVNTQTDSAQVEYNITCKNGSICSVIASCSRLGEDILATFTDISEHQRREQLLKKSYERRRKTDLINALIQRGVPSKQLVHESARIFGAKLMQPFSCFILVIETQQGKIDHLLLDTLLDSLDEGERFAWDSQDGIGVLCFASFDQEFDKDMQRKIADQLRKLIAAKAPTVKVSIGIAEPAASMSAIAESYRQACVSVNTGRKVWPEQRIYHYQDIGVYQLLANFTDENRSNEYIDRTLGKLLRYDKRKRAAYLATLELILMSDNLKASAEKLAIHYHTLMFRKQRLEQILEVSFEDYAARLAILNALHLLKLRQM